MTNNSSLDQRNYFITLGLRIRPDPSKQLSNEEKFHLNTTYLKEVFGIAKKYRFNVTNAPRDGKKLLVLDIDYTLYDHITDPKDKTAQQLMRPFLHEFLTNAYKDYDIAIWSRNTMEIIEEKLRFLGVSNNPAYKIIFCVDYLAMMSVCTKQGKMINVKPLGVIWAQFPQYSANNTIMIDDVSTNFLMNPQSGLRIRAYRSALINQPYDRALYVLGDYLREIAKLDNFSQLDHDKWEDYTWRCRREERRKKALEESGALKCESREGESEEGKNATAN